MSSTNSPTQPEDLALERTWAFWIHKKGSSSGAANYGSNMDMIGTCSTTGQFWQLLHQIPPPSEMFTNDRGVTKYDDREIEAVSVFRKDVRPEWEDPKNNFGAEFFLKKSMGGGQLDTYWEELLMGVIGETIDPVSTITGVRVVDKSSKGKFAYRVEVWFECNQESNPQLVEALKENITQVLNAGGQKLEYKLHTTSLAGGDHRGESKSHRRG